MRSIWLFCLLLILSFHVSGQVLLKMQQLSGPGNDYVSTFATDRDGNSYLAFSLGWSTGQNETYNVLGEISNVNGNAGPNFIKFNKNGDVVWKKSFVSGINSIAFDKDGNFYVTARYQQYSFLVAKFTPDGQEVWRKTEGSSGGFFGMDILVDENGNTYVTGSALSWSAFGVLLNKESCCGDHDFLVKFNAQGQQVWAIASAPNDYTNGRSLAFDASGNIMLAGQYRYSMNLGGLSLRNNIGYTSSYLARVSPEGQVLMLNEYGGSGGHTLINDMKVDTDGSIYLTGAFSSKTTFGGTSYISNGDYDFFVTKLDQQGKVLWFRKDGGSNIDQGQSIALSKDDLYVASVFSGNVTLDNSQLGSITGPTTSLIKINKDKGTALWAKGYGRLPTEYYSTYFNPVYVEEIAPRNLRIFGAFEHNVTSYDNTFTSRGRDLYTGQVIDTLIYNEPGAIVRGKVLASEFGDCDGGKPMSNIVIKAEPGPIYGFTNAQGDYQLRLPPGSYSISQILPAKKGMTINQSCPSNVPRRTINSIDDQPAPVNFTNQVSLKPFLSVDVGGAFRRCFPGELVVQYCNEGAAPAFNVKVVVNFPEHVIPLSSSVPWTSQSGGKLTFQLGTLSAGECRRILIHDSVRCGDESIRGMTQCVTATITPANPKTPDPSWDNSEIELPAKCLDNGFVKMVIANKGSGAMKTSANYSIYVDAVLAFEDEYLLSKSDSLVLQMPANGKTIRLEAMTTEGSPTTNLSATVEGCGASSRASISKGFVNLMAPPDEEPEVEIFCSAIGDSFDPNDKQAVPIGVTSEHRIRGDEEIEYLIRFQNTGTAPAHNVIVRDQLDPSLDISTLRASMASHNFSLRVEGAGNPELVWKFNNIMLPDSTSDEPGSHGFIKFTIKPHSGLARNTVINNSAAIYFDFNSPVITNEVFHTIGMPVSAPVQGALVLQDCSEEVVVNAGGNRELIVCDDKVVELEPLQQTGGYPYWQLISGSGDVRTDEQVEISNLDEGFNTFRYMVTHCNETDTATVSIQRVITPSKPSVSPNYSFCSSEVGTYLLNPAGDDIRWYSNENLSELLLKGNKYFPSTSQTVYVTDQELGCESAYAMVNVEVRQTPEAPTVGSGYEACQDVHTSLVADGTEVLWYQDFDDGYPTYTGTKLETVFTTPGIHDYFVSHMSAQGCESEKTELEIFVHEYDRARTFIPNVITPNGDHSNEDFHLPEQELSSCLGNFKQVIIYNRVGKTVFKSDKSDFHWNGEGTATGVYFYSIRFENDMLQGSVSVVR